MVLKALTLLITASVFLVNATPGPNANNGIEVVKRFSPGHNYGNALEARYTKRHARATKYTNKKRGGKIRRSCPANNSTTLATSSLVPAEDSAPTDSPAQTPNDPTPSSSSDPAPTDSGSDQSSGNTNSDTGSNNSSSNTSSSTTSASDVQAYLAAHNGERANHGADALTWADDLASVAQSWVNNCVWQHSGGQYGENLSTGTNMSPTGAVQLWLNEASQYDPSNPLLPLDTSCMERHTGSRLCSRYLLWTIHVWD